MKTCESKLILSDENIYGKKNQRLSAFRSFLRVDQAKQPKPQGRPKESTQYTPHIDLAKSQRSSWPAHA